jgi:hypothetical protein
MDSFFMIETVRTTLARLEPIKDRIFSAPMTGDELIALERDVALAIPSCLREYFRLVGLRQDLISYKESDYEVFAHAEDFREQRQFLIKHFGEAATLLFPFADDGAGNVVAVAEGQECCQLLFADHETLKLTEIGTFCAWLTKVVDAVLKQDLPLNREKKWCVQFSFRLAAPEPILVVLQQFGETRLGAWTEKGVTPAGVRCSEASFTFADRQMLLKKSEYHTWTQPMFSFDCHEPATVPKEQSIIRKLDQAFAAADLAYKLVDYGVLSKSEAPDPATASRAARPWWKFW